MLMGMGWLAALAYSIASSNQSNMVSMGSVGLYSSCSFSSLASRSTAGETCPYLLYKLFRMSMVVE